MKNLLAQLDQRVCDALFSVTNPSVKLSAKDKTKLEEIRIKLVDARLLITAALCDHKAGFVQSWQEAKATMPRSGTSSDDLMSRIRLADGSNVFKQVRGGRWIHTDHPTVINGYALVQSFRAENGGPTTFQMVAMLALAVDADKATAITAGEISTLTAGYEEDTNEWWRQQELGTKYPTIRAAILSFF